VAGRVGEPGDGLAGVAGEEPEATAGSVYTLGTSPVERERLRRQSQDLRAHAAALLDLVPLPAGSRVIDVGCGLGGMLDLLSERVGAGGHVLGLECDTAHAAAARAFADERGLANVEVVEGDARHTALASGSFDLAHARLLLVNIPRPAEVLAEMTRLVRPGGWVVCQEADYLGLCHPPHAAWTRLSEVLLTAYRQEGADPHLGRRLPELFRDAGLVDVRVRAMADAYPVGHAWRTLNLDLMRSLRPKILEGELLAEPELDDLQRAASDHVADAATVTMPFVLFSVWGRRPAAPADPPSP
jgi:SAM-dependent methyltransferase